MELKYIAGVVTLILTFPCGAVLLLLAASVDDYREPTDCNAFKVLSQPGVVLKCKLPFVNYQLNGANFSAVHSDYTLALDVVCDDATLMPHWESSFANVSLSHLKQLLELVFVNCDFRVLPSYLSSDTFPDTLIYLVLQRNYVGDGPAGRQAPSLEVMSGALSKLTRLSNLELTSFNIVALPSNELCHLSKLLGLNLSYNLLDDVELVGFSSTGTASSCGENLMSLDLSFNTLQAIKDESFAKLARLQLLFLQGNMIGELGARAFSNMSSLIQLDVSCNRLSRFPPNVWLDTGQLLILNASRNRLSGNLDEETFKNLEKLGILDLTSNSIDAISAGTFDNMVDLVEVFLLSNRIRTIGDLTFKSLVNLNTLDLSDNLIPYLTSTSLSGLENLSSLFLKNNTALSAIDENAFSRCPRVVNLTLSNNSLTAVPMLHHLKGLQVLDLSRNTITNIYNDSFSRLLQLISVDLEDNLIFLIDENSFDDNVELRRLNLANNRLSVIPDYVLETNTKLRFLDLSQNNLRYTVNFQMNPQLNYLNISRNQIAKLDYGLLPNGLSVLDVSHNRLTSVDEKFEFDESAQITYLDASYNELQSIANLPKNIQIVLLNNNNVSYVRSGSFAHMPYLMFVDLSYNAFITLQIGALEVQHTPTLSRPRFFFQGNFFDCDCTMKWIKTINEEHYRKSYLKLYGIVYDLPFLFCWIAEFENGGVRRDIALVTSTPDERFLCRFQEETFSDAICYRKIPHRTVCHVVCPLVGKCTCFRDPYWNVIAVKCSNAENVTQVPSNIPPMVMSLYLDGNAITQLFSETLGDLPALKRLYLNDSGLTNLVGEPFARTPALEELHLERNFLRELDNNTLFGLNALTFLDLSSNELSRIHEGVFRPLTSLKVLRLNDNNLVSFPVWTLSQSMRALSKVSLSENPWDCDCDYLEHYRDWLQSFAQIVTDPDKLFCQPGDNETLPIPLIAFNASTCFNASISTLTRVENNGNYIPLLAALMSTFLTVSLAIVLIYAYRKEMQVLVYSRYGVRLFHSTVDVDGDGRKVFDAFVSYSSLDENFIIQEILPKLEGTAEPTYKLCLHHRNFLAGGFIMDSIMEAIEKSRRTILILSDNFMKSEWCRFEFKSAHLQMLKDRRNRVILIILGKIPDQLDPEMKLYMKTNTYLQWGDRLFWQKLYFALPEVRKPEA